MISLTFTITDIRDVEELQEIESIITILRHTVNSAKVPIPTPQKLQETFTNTKQFIQPIESTEVDSMGVTYDPKIHSEKKTTNADGTWRKKKNSMPQNINQIQAIPQVPPPPPLVSNSTETFVSLMTRIGEATFSGKITQAEVQRIANEILNGAPITVLSTRTDLIPVFAKRIDSTIKDNSHGSE
jgi:hypothetical protein